VDERKPSDNTSDETDRAYQQHSDGGQHAEYDQEVCDEPEDTHRCVGILPHAGKPRRPVPPPHADVETPRLRIPPLTPFKILLTRRKSAEGVKHTTSQTLAFTRLFVQGLQPCRQSLYCVFSFPVTMCLV